MPFSWWLQRSMPRKQEWKDLDLMCFRVSSRQATHCHSSMIAKQIFPLPLKDPEDRHFPGRDHPFGHRCARHTHQSPRQGRGLAPIDEESALDAQKNHFAVAGEGNAKARPDTPACLAQNAPQAAFPYRPSCNSVTCLLHGRNGDSFRASDAVRRRTGVARDNHMARACGLS